MLHKVFLDTNIYDRSNYSFRNALFSALRNKSSQNELELHINSVIEGEVESHIKRDVKKAAKELLEAASHPKFAGFRKISPYQEKLDIPKADEWVQEAISEFQLLLSDCRVKRISVNNVDLEKIMSDYFQINPPFEAKKPEEFKDAIAVASIVKEMENLSEDELYYIVSNDKGFREAIKQYSSSENIRYYDDLKLFVDYLATLDIRAQKLKSYLISDKAYDMIYESIKESILAATIDIERMDFIDDLDIIDVDDMAWKPYIVSIDDENDVARVAIEAQCTVKVYYKYTDEDNSFYDKEDGVYLWQEVVEIEESYKVELNLTISLDISNCEIDTDEESEYVEFMEYVDMPDRIDLEEYNLIESEVVSDSGPFYDEYDQDEDRIVREYATTRCPDCGAPIGVKSDGGGGFCVVCAPNH